MLPARPEPCHDCPFLHPYVSYSVDKTQLAHMADSGHACHNERVIIETGWAKTVDMLASRECAGAAYFNATRQKFFRPRKRGGDE